MSLRQSDSQPATAANPRSGSALAESPRRSEAANRKLLRADTRLVKRCVAGEVSAWEELYTQCHEPLLFSIKVMLRPGNADPNLVDELAARVWYALIKDDAKLLSKYDSRRGALLITFLMSVAKSELTHHFRTEKRREKRERIALTGKLAHHSNDEVQTAASLAEFLPALTSREREYYDDHLLGHPGNGDCSAAGSFSLSNARQLEHRIRGKLLRFLGYEL
jgi:DNA-directed RNA polymerase specialized sigma24 family protein